MTPDALRAAIASARLRPRMYAQTAEHLASMLYGMIAGAAPDAVDIGPAWGDAYSPANVHAPTDAEVCDAAEATVAALWPQGDAPAPPLSPDQVAAWRRNSDALSGAYVDARAEIDRLTAEAERLRAESAARLACADHVRDDIRATAKSADVPGGDPVATAKRMANCIRRLRAQLAAAQPVLMLDAIRRGPPSTWVRCLACAGTGVEVDAEGEGVSCEPCRGTGRHPPPHPVEATDDVFEEFARAWAADTDLCPKCGALDLGRACEKSAATVAGEAFAAEHPYAAGAVMGGVAKMEVDDGR